jgi:aspartate ammonia-lyase
LRPARDLVAIMQSMADFADLSGTLNTLAVDLTKIANDLRLLASGPRTGLDEIRLPALQPGSSIMPGKVNPVMPEMTNMVAFQVMGNHLTVTLAAQAGQLELNVMMPLIAHNLCFSIEILTNAVNALAIKCVRGITANAARCRDYAEKSVSIATALNPLIGYRKTAKLVQEAVARDVSFLKLALEKRLAEPQRLRKILDPTKLADPHR